MTQDILEQIVEDWFRRKPGVFTKTNIKYRPNQSGFSKAQKQKYSVHSDIDVVAVSSNSTGPEKVSVVSCKSWQIGFDVRMLYKNLSDPKLRKKMWGSGEFWKKFRELVDPVWAK